MRDRSASHLVRVSPPVLGVPRIGPVLIAIILLHVGLFFSIVVLMFLAFGLTKMREAWLQELPYGLTTFEAFSVIALLIAGLIIFEAIFTRDRRDSRSFGVVAYGSNLIFVAGLASALVALGAGPLNDDWYRAAVEREEYFLERSFVGRILERDATGCRPVATCLRVELHNGDVVPAELRDESDLYPRRIWRPRRHESGNWYYVPEIVDDPGPSEIVYVDELVGQFSDTTYYEATYTTPWTIPDPDTYWHRMQSPSR